MLSYEFLKTWQNSFFKKQLWTAACNFGKYLETSSINYDLSEYLKTDHNNLFLESIWNFGVAAKES